MKVTTIITKALTILKLLAERDARRATEKQKRYRKNAQRRADLAQAERVRLERRVAELNGELGAARAQVTLGCSQAQEELRVATSLAKRIDGLLS